MIVKRARYAAMAMGEIMQSQPERNQPIEGDGLKTGILRQFRTVAKVVALAIPGAGRRNRNHVRSGADRAFNVRFPTLNSRLKFAKILAAGSATPEKFGLE